MRVLTIGNLYPPHHFGGYEQVWCAAVSHLRAHGDTVRVLAADTRLPGRADGDEPGVYRTLRWYWDAHEFAALPIAERFRIERHNQRQLRRHLRELAPELVSFWSMGGMSHSLIEQVRRAGIPMVAFVHDGWLGYGRSSDQWTRMFAAARYRPAAPVVEKFSGIPTQVDYGRAGRYVFVSDFMRRSSLALGLGLRDTAVAHSGISQLFYSAQPPSAEDWQWRLLYVGRLHPDKGTEDAIRSLRALPPQATLTVAGEWDPRDEAALGGLIAELRLTERVTLRGQLPLGEVAELYRESDVLLFPVRWEEPWGLVPLEAMACGCPVIATGRGGSGEYLRPGENSLVVAPRAPDEIATAVARLAADPALRNRLRRNGRQTALMHTEATFNDLVRRHVHEVGARSSSPAAGATPLQSAAA